MYFDKPGVQVCGVDVQRADEPGAAAALQQQDGDHHQQPIQRAHQPLPPRPTQQQDRAHRGGRPRPLRSAQAGGRRNLKGTVSRDFCYRLFS